MFRKSFILCLILFISIAVFGNISNAKTDQGPPDAFLNFFNSMMPKTIGNIVSVYHNGEIWLFYEKMSMAPNSFSEENTNAMPLMEGATYYAVWDGAKWSKEQEFGWRVYAAVSYGNEMIVFGEGGYRTLYGTQWSAIYNVEGLTKPFTCVTPEGVYVFYKKGDTLVYRILNDEGITEEIKALHNWDYNKGVPSLMNMSYAKAVYVFDKIWIFYSKDVGPNSELAFRTLINNQWSDERSLMAVMQYSPVVSGGQLYLFYVNWINQDPANIDLMNMHKQMMRTNYVVFNGNRWSEPEYVQTGQTMLIDSLAVQNDLILFVGAMVSVNYVEFIDGSWSKLQYIGTKRPEMAFAFRGFAMYFGGFVFFTLFVWLISNNIDKHKKVVFALGQKQYEAATLLQRYIAYAIDFAIIYGVWMLASSGMMSPEGEFLFDNFWIMWAVMFFEYFLGGLFYFSLLEGKWGKTVGKFIMQIKVISENGEKCGFKKALIRNCLRIVDGIFGYLVGVIIFSQSEKRQRLGDKVAKTYVVLKGAKPLVVAEETSS